MEKVIFMYKSFLTVPGLMWEMFWMPPEITKTRPGSSKILMNLFLNRHPLISISASDWFMVHPHSTLCSHRHLSQCLRFYGTSLSQNSRALQLKPSSTFDSWLCCCCQIAPSPCQHNKQQPCAGDWSLKLIGSLRFQEFEWAPALTLSLGLWHPPSSQAVSHSRPAQRGEKRGQ